MEAIARFMQWNGVLIVPTLISLVYFWTSPKQQGLATRLWASCHGIVLASIYLGAFFISEMKLSEPIYGWLFAISMLLPLSLMALSFFLYEGPTYVHLLHLVGLICVLWTMFVGGMAITGNWL